MIAMRERDPIAGIDPMLCRKDVCDILQVSDRTMDRLMSSERDRRKLGAKKVHGHWRFIRWRVEMFAQTYSG